jgi:hypothetical protein
MELSHPEWSLCEFMQSVTFRRVGLAAIAFAFLVYFALADWSCNDCCGEKEKFNVCVVFLCACCLFAGTALLFHEFDTYLSGKTEVHISGRASTPGTKHRTDRRVAVMPAFGLIAATFYSLVVMFGLFLGAFLWPRESKGLYVRTISSLKQAIRYPGAEPLIVTIDTQKHYFVNVKKVAPDKLQSILADALRLRFTKAVFVQADPEAEVADVFLAVDAIKGVGAQAILVSEAPKKRRE